MSAEERQTVETKSELRLDYQFANRWMETLWL